MYHSSASRCVCEEEGRYWCAKCRAQRYCSKECQLKDLEEHRKVCSDKLPTKENDSSRALYVDIYDALTNNLSPLGKGKTMAEEDRIDARNLGRSPDCVNGYIMIPCYVHILSKWTKLLIEMLNRMDQIEKTVIYHIVVATPDKPLFRLMRSKPKYITFALIFTESISDFIFILYSNHAEGVYDHVCVPRNNFYICSSENAYSITEFGKKWSTDLQVPIRADPSKSINYILVDWMTGEKIQEEPLPRLVSQLDLLRVVK